MDFEGDESTRNAAAREPWPRFALLRTLLLLAVASCRSLELTPAALRAAGGRQDERAAALARWEEALVLINEFMASPYRRTLPPGRFELGPKGMSFQSEAGRRWTVEVCSSSWGDLVVNSGFRAQEGEDGFCVGSIDHGQIEHADALLDNTFFRYSDGDWHDSDSLAEVTLHETTHVVYRAGTIGPWNTIHYYLVAIFTLSSVHHPAEDRPRATSGEFVRFLIAREAPPE
jgi:hypothetical protein